MVRKIEISNRVLYSLITFGLLILLSVGIYALAPSIDTKKGYHESSQISLKLDGEEKTLQEVIDNEELKTSLPVCQEGEVLKSENNEWVCSQDLDTDTQLDTSEIINQIRNSLEVVRSHRTVSWRGGVSHTAYCPSGKVITGGSCACGPQYGAYVVMSLANSPSAYRCVCGNSNEVLIYAICI